MAWTALHAALGELAGPMSFSMVERAIAEKIRERADLDWKRSLPLREEGNDEAEDELAKDVAAMSNSGGGVIVYGVAERDGRADALHPLDDLTEGRMRQIRQVASARIYPPLVDLDLIPLHSVDQPTKSVLLVVVPDSVDAPHLVHPAGKRELFRVPWRDGPETRFMVERQIESAYQARLQRRRAGREALDELTERLVEKLPATGARRDTGITYPQAWVYGIARPTNPVGPLWARPHEDQVVQILNGAKELSDRLMPGRYPRPVDVLHGYTVLRGLRSYYRRTVPMHAQTHASQQEAARIEIHLDGTVAACVTRGGTDYSDYGSPSTPGAIAVSDIENTAADLFTLAVCAQTALGVRGDFAARIGITPPTQLFRHPDRSNPAAFRPYQEIDRVATPQPVDGPLLTSMGAASAAASWVEVASEMLYQVGGNPSDVFSTLSQRMK